MRAILKIERESFLVPKGQNTDTLAQMVFGLKNVTKYGSRYSETVSSPSVEIALVPDEAIELKPEKEEEEE